MKWVGVSALEHDDGWRQASVRMTAPAPGPPAPSIEQVKLLKCYEVKDNEGINVKWMTQYSEKDSLSFMGGDYMVQTNLLPVIIVR